MSTNNEDQIVQAGVHFYSPAENYVWPKEQELLDQLEWFRDQKLALMMHWGLYNQLGIVASWALSDVDDEWSRHQINWTDDAKVFKEQYSNLNRSFNPVRFQAEEWAQMAKDNGFKYLILTTKHHDGFCLWDSKETEYKTTAKDCPFHTHEQADIVGSMFKAFQEKDLGIGAYFSKADWHTENYRMPESEGGKPSNRGPMYDPKENPERWEKFIEFTHNQLRELTSNYGKVDILWFDGGWVSPKSGQDIRLGEIVDEIREKQPGILAVDRLIGGPYENYITPEMMIPKDPIDVPWEACLTLGVDFAYEYGDRYKTPRQLVDTLVNIVAKGGNLALNISPQPDGRIPVDAMNSINGLGNWLNTYGEAIYGTRICAPYHKNDISFTKKGDTVYAIRVYPEDRTMVKQAIFIPYTGEVKTVSLLDSGEVLDFKKEADGSGFTVTMPKGRYGSSSPIALVFKIEA